jgi:hypothetical protein
MMAQVAELEEESMKTGESLSAIVNTDSELSYNYI